ncbi:MAG: glycosyltransferase family 39 protein [Methanomassiliicoccales archaeon]|nr:MAG: glycosyltransferase family 39 protein [Methanomassiliicoccales archaeon]
MPPENAEDIETLINKAMRFLFSEIEIYVLMVILAYWYVLNFPGALMSSDALYADLAHHYLKGDFNYYYGLNPRPLPIYFMSLGEILFGQNSFGYAFFPFIFGILSVYLTYKIGTELGNRFTGIMAALILGLTPAFAFGAVNVVLETTRAFFVLFFLFLAMRYSKTGDVKRKRIYIILMGIALACGLLAKQDMLFFIFAIFIYLLVKERTYIMELIKKYTLYIKDPNTIKKVIKSNKVTFTVSVVLGLVFGFTGKIVVDSIWSNLSQTRRDRAITKFPPLFRHAVENPESVQAWLYYLVLCIIVFLIVWLLYIILRYDSKTVFKWFFRARKLNKIQKVIACIITFSVCYLVLFIPYLSRPHFLVYHLFTNYFGEIIGIYSSETAVGGEGHLVELGGELYTKPPIWAYAYWINENLGLTYVVGIIIALAYSIYLVISKDMKKIRHFGLLYTIIAIPLILYHIRPIKLFYQLFPLFPLFLIFITTHVFDAGSLVASKIPSLSRNDIPRYLGALSCIILLILPTSPLISSISEPDMKTDSGYDIAAEQVIAYAIAHSNETVTVIAQNSFTLEYYMGEDMPDNVETIDRLWGNISEDERYDMVIAGEVSVVVGVDDSRTRDSDLNLYVKQNAVSEYRIEDSTTGTVIYFLQ